jgi:hypothetical protein
MGSDAMLIDVVVRRAVLGVVIAALAGVAVFTQAGPGVPAGPAVAAGPGVLPGQFEIAGSWAPLGTEDVQNDSVPVDYLGLALTDDARARALSYDESQKSMMDRQCQGWGAAYAVLGPFGL